MAFCGEPQCRAEFINFDVTAADARHVAVRDGQARDDRDDALRARLEEYGAFLRSIGQEQVMRTIANVLASMAG